MRFLLFFIFGLCLAITAGRPSLQAEESDRDNGEAEYDESDIASAQDYIQDERGIEKKGVQGSNDREDSPNDEEVMIYSESIADRPLHKSNKQFLDGQKLKGRNMREGDILNEDSLGNKKDMNVLKGRSHNQPLVHLSLTNHNTHNADEFDDMPAQAHEESELFKNYSQDKKAGLSENHDEVEEINQRSMNSLRKEPYNTRLSAMKSERKLDDGYFLDRGRRQVSPSDESVLDAVKNIPKDKDVVSDSISNPSSNTEDIKELSKQDLEDLLNSLSNEKINILKKIINDNESINKREVTKKSGAMAEDNYVESGRGDVTGFYSITDLQTDSNKNSEGFDSSKRSDFDSPTTKSENDEVSAIKQDKSKLSESETGFINPKDQSKVKGSIVENVKELKNEKKRDTNSEEETSLKINDYKEFGTDQDTHYNNDWLDVEDNSEIQKFNKKIKREIPDENASDLSNSLKSLEESFPTINSGGDANIKSDLTPLVRVKRTSESDNDKEGDLNIQHSDACLVPLLPDNDDLERDEKNEIEDYGLFGQEKHLLINDNPEKVAEKQFSIQPQEPAINHKNGAYDHSVKNFKSEIDNISIGSDTDRVLSSVEGVDENLMYKSGVRRKRMEKSLPNDNLIDNYDKQICYNSQITRKDGNSCLENSENASQLNGADNLGQISENKDVSRYKRIRQVKYIDSNI